ncbi:methyltransferase domain-containing protein [Micromonospora olivasterospora]|nr:class I SAM-dependent methyltransferase [Micromonospora olivasterospora]
MSDLYDLVYEGRGKPYAAEAALVTDLVRARRPDAASLLDVACGTGGHLVPLRAMFDHVEGVDVSPDMCAVARGKLPGVPIHEADMLGLDLGHRFDAVCCLYSALGYLSSTRELTAAVGRMARHLTPGGVLLVEPWWFPDRFLDGYVGDDVVRGPQRTVARLSHSVREGDVARQETHYLVADAGGVRHFRHVQRLTLFAYDDYAAAFRAAGCRVEYLPDAVPSGRGLFVGVAA